MRTWEFLPIVGTKAGIFGNESGRMEAWVYPLKVFRDLHVTFHLAGRILPAESLARTLTVRPESATLLHSGDSFRVAETFFVPVQEAGAIVLFEVETEQPLEIEVGFTGDFSLEWPAALGGTYSDWDATHHRMIFGEETKKFAALVGSPSAEDAHLAYQANYSSSQETSFRLGVTQKGREVKLLVFAASVNGRDEAQQIYDRLAASYVDLLRESADYYSKYLSRTVSLELPDPILQQAYDWARVSEIQGLVVNPYLGTGLVAGYRTSGFTERPGFAWFFGRDSLWTSFGLNSVGDFATTRLALEFLAKYQRDDGKIPHEIAQGAPFVSWFKDYPYAYASADATPLFIIAFDDYATRSGDITFIREKWDSLWKAYQFLRSTYNTQGFPKNLGVGHGWVEGGPLLPVETEYYQSGLGTEALRAIAHLGQLAGVKVDLYREFEQRKAALDAAFWSPEKKIYAFALNQAGQRIEETSVLATVPMWFGLSDASHANDMITQLADNDIQTDWGMRIISEHSSIYSGSGYHYGAVWPLFTGWASVAEYRYHRVFPAYLNLRANAALTMDVSLGHFTEVLSGDYYESLSTSSPHQIWSAAMVINPLLRGMFGLRTDVGAHQVTLEPHVPADWTSFALRNIRVGSATLDLQYRKTTSSIVLEVRRSGQGDCWIEFSPALSLRAEVLAVEMNGRPLPFKLLANSKDQHLSVRFPAHDGPSTVAIRLRNDFGLALTGQPLLLGSSRRAMHVLSESWNSSHTELTLQLSGLSGAEYELLAWNPEQIASLDGGSIDQTTGEHPISDKAIGKIRIKFPDGQQHAYVRRTLTLKFIKPSP